MKKNFFSLIITISMIINSQILGCPRGFSPDDKRPFFEQYETEINVPTPQEKEEKS